jgi:hypothetical protein
VLSLGLVAIHQSFFASLNAVDHLSYRLNAGLLAANRIWLIQDALKRSQGVWQVASSGKSESNGKPFDWRFTSVSVGNTADLYGIDLYLSWPEGRKKGELTRSAYVLR